MTDMTSLSTRPESAKTLRHLEEIEALGDRDMISVLEHLAGSLFLNTALQILDKVMYEQTDRAGRRAIALARIHGTGSAGRLPLGSEDAREVLRSMAGLVCTDQALNAVTGR